MAKAPDFDTEAPEDETESARPTPPPLFVNRHGDVKMGWKALFLLLSIITGPLGVSLWWWMDHRGHTWNDDHGRTWRSNEYAPDTSSGSLEGPGGGEPDPV